jgi:hypothetical protein
MKRVTASFLSAGANELVWRTIRKHLGVLRNLGDAGCDLRSS